ncbi:MAG: putative zinc-binding protein [Actinobacteria bacterium]|nr:putative zinc-binding protein [Actinomycetota bacterium]
MDNKKVIVIPCSGIGKPIGTVSREVAYEIMRLKPDTAETVCLAALTSGDEESIKKIKDNYVITLDGCAKHCAQKNTQAYGKEPDKNYMILKFAAQNPDKKPEGIIDIGKGGRELVKTISEKIVSDIDEIKQNEKK